jgi:[calcium/calmodulin-dependent protein kinase] kinase
MDLVEPPSDLEVNHAITAKMGNLLVVMKAVQKFMSLLDKKRPAALSGVLGKGIRTLHPLSIDGHSEPTLHKSKSSDLDDRRIVEAVLAAEGVHRDMTSKIDDSMVVDEPQEEHTPHHKGHKLNEDELPPSHPVLRSESSGEKGHAHDPLDEEPLFLGIGTGGADESLDVPTQEIVAESPTAAEFSIYELAYQKEVERIRAAQGHTATVYLTRRVDGKKEYKADENMIEAPNAAQVEGSMPHKGFKGLLDEAREKSSQPEVKNAGSKFSDIAAKAIEDTRAKGGAALEGVLAKAREKREEMSETSRSEMR